MAALSALQDKLEAGLEQFLKAKRDAGKLTAFTQGEELRSRFAAAWNALLAGAEQPWHRDTIVQRLSYATTNSGHWWAGAELPLDERARKVHRELVERTDCGSFEYFDFMADDECAITGERLRLELHDWVPVLGTVDLKSATTLRDREFVPVTRLPERGVEHLVIEAPSGELLISDWFRHPAFTEAVNDPASRGEYSVNTHAGKARQTAWYAARGFASIFVGNTMPSVVARDGHLIIACVDEDAAYEGRPGLEGEALGSVCTDLWWATAIDREVLTRTMAQTLGRAEAESAVAELLESTDHVSVRVQPGMLHLYHTADPYLMQELGCPVVSDVAVEQMYGVLSQTELCWMPKSQLQAPAPQAAAPTPAAASKVRRPRP